MDGRIATENPWTDRLPVPSLAASPQTLYAQGRVHSEISSRKERRREEQMNKPKPNGKIAFIPGANRGLGLETATTALAARSSVLANHFPGNTNQ